MITKENFIKYMNELKTFRDTEEKINEVGSLFELNISFSEYENLIVNILQDSFNDTKNTWISYFIYDLVFGEKWTIYSVTTKNGYDIPLKDAEDLYNLLIKNMEDK